jgi:hypothetical protein
MDDRPQHAMNGKVPRMERQSHISSFKDGRVIALCIGCLFAGFLGGLLIFGSPWHLPPAWGDIPTWITGIASTVLAVFAVVTASYARQAFLKQSQEVDALLEERQRDLAERRITQAARVFTGVTGDVPARPYAKNGSDFPIFDAQLWYPEPGGISGPDDLGIIVPGGTVKTKRLLHADEPLSLTTLAFRDAAGIRWIRTPDGDFKEQRSTTTHVIVLQALGLEVPGPGPRLPGPEGGHSLVTAFRRLDGQITGPVLDSIVIYPGSRGILSMPGHAIRPNQEHRVEVTSSDPHNQGVYTEEQRIVGPWGYKVNCSVWNYRETPVHAKIILLEHAEGAPPES